jgi:OHCU decarboxylase
VTIDELNALDLPAFTSALGWIFEGSPWVAERVWRLRPFDGIEQLHAAMTAAVTAATLDEQLALLHTHPDLGTRARMSEVSTGEQAAVGLDQLTVEEFDRLHRLNAAYREKFGYPFLFAVRGSDKHQILNALDSRLTRTPQQELDEALRQVYRIALFRLQGFIDA